MHALTASKRPSSIIRAWDNNWNLLATFPEGAAVTQDGDLVTTGDNEAARAILAAAQDGKTPHITVDSERGRWSGRIDSGSHVSAEGLPDYMTLKVVKEDDEKINSYLCGSNLELPWPSFNEIGDKA